MKKTIWLIAKVLAILIGLYPFIYFIIDRKFGLLGTKTQVLLNDSAWNLAFYAHIIFGGLALLIGWLQFSSELRKNKIDLHRKIGKIYVISVMFSGLSGLYIAIHATGGLISIIGFFTLGIIWIATTIQAFRLVKKGEIQLHENLMIFSYAACFGAVTLRIWLPILVSLFDDFIIAYRIVAWLAWVPNVIVAYFIVDSKKPN